MEFNLEMSKVAEKKFLKTLQYFNFEAKGISEDEDKNCIATMRSKDGALSTRCKKEDGIRVTKSIDGWFMCKGIWISYDVKAYRDFSVIGYQDEEIEHYSQHLINGNIDILFAIYKLSDLKLDSRILLPEMFITLSQIKKWKPDPYVLKGSDPNNIKQGKSTSDFSAICKLTKTKQCGMPSYSYKNRDYLFINVLNRLCDDYFINK